MASRQETVDDVLDALEGVPDVSAKKMFGEYAVYSGSKVTALVADDMFFMRPSSASGPFEAECELLPPYPGAKGHHHVPRAKWADQGWMRALFEATAAALPEPKPKKPRV